MELVTPAEHAETLKHYGVKGMKWGVRKDERSPEQRDLDKVKRKERLKKAGKGLAVGVGSVAIGATAVYATRNTPQTKRGLDFVAKTARKSSAKISDIKHSRDYRRGQRSWKKMTKNNPWMDADTKWESFTSYNEQHPQRSSSNPVVDRLIKKVDRGSSYKEAMAGEAGRFILKTSAQYAHARVKDKSRTASSDAKTKLRELRDRVRLL